MKLMILALLAAATCAAAAEKTFVKPVKTVYVDDVWSGCPVGFALANRDGKQYVAYYNAEQQMVVACRSLDSEKWTYQKLDEKIGWDSHNYIALAFDSDGYIHLSGNMHGVPLKYFRTTKPGDITTFERVPSMTGANERSVTYPRFFTGPGGMMLFAYRDGGSGNGSEIVNAYDPKTRAWTRYIDRPLFDGQGKVSAYYSGPARDSRGESHFAWCWRDTGDCSTNHDVCYVKSRTLKSDFTKSDGTPVSLPLTMDNAEVVDPIPAKGGLLNRVILSFDSKDRVMLSYMKFDVAGSTQIYTARREKAGWRVYPTTDWKHRWDFSGGGTIPMEIIYNAPQVWRGGKLCQVYTNKFASPDQFIRFLDEHSLKQLGEPLRVFPNDFDTPKAAHTEDWQVNVTGFSPSTIAREKQCWALRWESTGPNRDRPRATVPPPSRLEVVLLAEIAVSSQ